MRLTVLALALTALAVGAETPKKSETVTFELEANLIWVQVKLDGKGPFRMAFDTGASTTVLLPDVAYEEGILKKGGAEVFDGLRFATIEEARIGTLVVPKLKVAVTQVPQLTGPAELMKMKADGVLGFNFISRFVTTIDYKARTIRFTETDFVPPDPEIHLPGVHANPTGWLGVQVEDADVRDVRRHGYDGGLKVNDVTELSPCEKAGLKPGDIIVDIGGMPITRAGTLRDFLRRATPGQKIVIMLIREGELWEKDVIIGKVRENTK